MYRVLLADDDPLMLSGIKRLIDWEKNGCLVVGTASSGTEALEKLEKTRPDMVICDIAMPGLSGLALLKEADEKFPGTVFIMLTNRAEFEFARESLRYRAVEYLMKNNLESGTLEKALARAIEEFKNRNKLRRVEEADEYLHLRQRQAQIRDAVALLLQKDEPLPPEQAALLEGEGMLSAFAFAFIPLNFAVLPGYPNMRDEEKQNVFEWELEITERLGSSFFPRVLLLPRFTAADTSFLLFTWGCGGTYRGASTIPSIPIGGGGGGYFNEGSWGSGISPFRKQRIKISGQITRLGVEGLASGI
ncbi:MAG: response regulator, partial [Treponema sp.]|nr:response regulator [Treponema sp.]